MKSALKKVSLILAICFVAFHLYTAAFGTMPGIAQKSIHLGFLLVIFYINAMVDSEKRWEQIFLGIMALFALGGCAYITILDENLQLRAGIVYASDILFAILLIIAIFEACRRKMGNPLVIITLVFVAYAFLGKYIPGFLNQPGMTLKKFTSLVYLTTDGIFGSPLYASASYVVLFVLLGAIMSVSGIGDYMTNLATSLFGHMRGGPAKVAVVASGFFGSISGSPTANVIGTGTFTIPMMKKNGFEPEFAAAVEATASTGGAIMPPIMGSTAFIMAEMLGIPYTAVAKAALIPAILYFLAVLFGVDIYAAKHGLKGIPRSQLPKVRSMLKQIYMLAPLIFLIFCMAVFNMTIVRSGLLTIIVTLVLVEINPKTRMTKEQWLQIPVQTVKSAVSVGIACAMAGIISGVIMGSGLGYRISSILTSVAGTSMLLLLVLTMVVSLIMGMGRPNHGGLSGSGLPGSPHDDSVGHSPAGRPHVHLLLRLHLLHHPPCGAGRLCRRRPGRVRSKQDRLQGVPSGLLFLPHAVLVCLQSGTADGGRRAGHPLEPGYRAHRRLSAGLRLRGLLLPLEPEVVRASAHDTGRCDADCARYGHRFGRYRHHRGGVCHRVHV